MEITKSAKDLSNNGIYDNTKFKKHNVMYYNIKILYYFIL